MKRFRLIKTAVTVMALGVATSFATAANVTYTPSGGTATTYTPGAPGSGGTANAVGGSGIRGSAHDFGGQTWSGNEICRPCHAPHNTTPTSATIVTTNGTTQVSQQILSGPLWNHTLAQNGQYKMYISVSQTYTLPAGYTVNGTNTLSTSYQQATTGQNVDTNSILCLSCHDGTVALDSFGGATGNQYMNGGVVGGANFGTDLTNDHPIGAGAIWTNPSYMVPQELRDAQGIMPIRLMPDGTKAVGCTSCHEPHNRTGNPNMLWVPNNKAGTTVDGRAVSGSLLCMNCHKK
jgi:hypothetical protein